MVKFNGLGEVTHEELAGFTLVDLKCHACSGYGNCGYRMYRLSEGKPVIICQYRKDKLIRERESSDKLPR